MALDLRLARAENDSLRPFSRRLYALWEFLLAGSAEPLILLDAAGAVKGVNAAGERLLGQKGMHLTGRPLASFLREDCEVLAALRAAWTSGVEPKLLRVKVRPAAGTEMEASLRVRKYEVAGASEWWALIRPGA